MKLRLADMFTYIAFASKSTYKEAVETRKFLIEVQASAVSDVTVPTRIEVMTNCQLVRSFEHVRGAVIYVKVTLVQALRLCTGRTAHRGSRGIALLFHDQRH